MKTVKIGKLPGRIQEVVVAADATVRQIADAAQLGDIAGYQIKAGSENLTPDSRVSDGATVILSKMVKGN